MTLTATLTKQPKINTVVIMNDIVAALAKDFHQYGAPRLPRARVECPAAPETASGILDLALRLLERYGWGRNTLLSPDGRLCTVGAIIAAGTGGDVGKPTYGWTPALHQAMRAVAATLLLPSNDVCVNIAQWNDLMARSVGQVASVLQRAAASCRRQEEAAAINAAWAKFADNLHKLERELIV